MSEYGKMERSRDADDIKEHMSGQWWTLDEDEGDEMAGLIWSYVGALEPWQRMRQSINAENARMYWGKHVWGIGGPRALGTFHAASGAVYNVTENGIASVVDTATSLIAADRPKPVFMTEGEGWEKQRQAKKLGQFVLGEYEKLGVYKLGVRVFKDCAIFDTGLVKVYGGKTGPCVERVLSDDIIVDEQESRDVPPRQMHQRRWVDRYVLMRLYPEAADYIAQAPSTGIKRGAYGSGNMIEMLESWHLPSEEGADDGVYAVCVAGRCLHRAAYDKDYFPFVPLRWNDPLTGWYGQGIVEPLTNLQIDLNGINKFIRRCQKAVIKPDVYGAFNQRMPDAFFETGVARYFQTRDGKPPTFYTPNALNAETYNERIRIVERMFQLAGVGEMSAQSKKPAGLDSGVALREYKDQQTGRFSIQAEAFEDWHIEVAKRLVWAMADVDEKSRAKVTVAFRAKSFIKTIAWSDVDPKEDPFHVSVQASSLISRTPAGKKQEAMDMLQLGVVDKAEFRNMTNMNNTEESVDIDDAAFQYAQYACERICEGEFVAPEPFEDLHLCVKYTQLVRLKAKLDGADKTEFGREVLENLQLRIDLANKMIQDMTAPPPMPPGPPVMEPMAGGPPPGGPMPPPGAMPPGGMVPGAPIAPPMGVPGTPLPPGV